MQLTFSKLDTYNKCLLRFRLSYQEKLPETPCDAGLTSPSSCIRPWRPFSSRSAVTPAWRPC